MPPKQEKQALIKYLNNPIRKHLMSNHAPNMPYIMLRKN